MGQIKEKLGLEHFSKNGFINLINYLIDEVPPRRVVTAHRSQPPAHEPFEFYPYSVFDLPLAGEKEMVFCGQDGLCRSEILRSGDVFQLPPSVWKLPRWTRPHEMACLVFQKRFLRITYVELESPLLRGIRPVSNCFFHTAQPPTEDMLTLVRLLNKLGSSGDPGGCAPELMRALLRLIKVMLTNTETVKLPKAQATFRQIRHYLLENYTSQITREDIARRFKLNPGYLSRLFHAQEGCTFSEFLIRLRLKRAVMLLQETDLLVDEVADGCGYQSTTFFTNLFKQHYGLPPARYRSSYRDTKNK